MREIDIWALTPEKLIQGKADYIPKAESSKYELHEDFVKRLEGEIVVDLIVDLNNAPLKKRKAPLS